MTKFRDFALFAASLLFAGSASAATFTCPVKPAAFLGMDASGDVFVAINNNTIQMICSVHASVGVYTDACTAWYSTLLTWRATNRSGYLYYDTDNSANAGFTSCSQAQDWQTHIPYFIEGA